MYEELVKRLRVCRDGENCTKCPMRHDEEVDRLLVRVRCTACDAADAIENQQVIIRAQKAVLDQAPHWIPSKDCLPVNGEEVITLGPNGGMEVGFYRGLCGTKKEKWEWKKHTVRTVKYWIPRKALPEPPKKG